MQQATETREVISLVVDGVSLQGTYHKPQNAAAASEANRVGVLFLNPGFLPRATPSTIFWADSFANIGYPCFRVDLPGLGDSEGDVPAKMLDFVNAGGYAPIVSEIVRQLVARFGLSGMVIMGLCAGAVSAMFTAAVSPECRGLVMMDPYFFLPGERTRMREKLGEWATWNRLGAISSKLYDRLRHIRLLVNRNKLPHNANLPLLGCWNKLTAATVPILILKAPAPRTRDEQPRVGEFDYLKYLQASSDRSGRVAVSFIEGTNHSFADTVGRAAVRQHVEKWLRTYFSPSSPEVPASRAASVTVAD